MAEMFQSKKQSLKKSDYSKAIVKANDRLKAKNKSLESSIKDQKKELKSLEKQRTESYKKLNKLLIDVEFQEDRVKKLSGGIYSNEKLLADKLKKVSKAEKDHKGYKNDVLKLEKKEGALLDKIAGLEFYKSKCETSKTELAGIQVKKDSSLKELDKIEDEIAKASEEAAEKISYYEDQYDALEEKAKKHEDMVFQFAQRLFETEDQFKREEGRLRDLLAKSKVEKEKANDELQAITNLCNNTEDKYIKWEQKIAKAKATADKEVERNKKAIESFKRWKIGILEEVARLKLKNKVDNIDKAGLSDILNG